VSQHAVLALSLILSAIGTAHAQTLSLPATLPSPPADSSLSRSDFGVRAIPRSAFSLPLPPRLTERVREERRPSPALLADARRETAWQSARFHAFRSSSSVRGAHETDTQLRLGLETLVRYGRLGAEFDAAEREDQRRLSRALLRLDTFSGWRLTGGDLPAVARGPVARGLTARGVRVERTSRSGAELGVTTEMLFGRAAVRHENALASRFPRSVGMLRVSGRLVPGLTATAQWAHLADHARSDIVGDRPIRSGQTYGVGFEGRYRRVRADLALSRLAQRRDGMGREVGGQLVYRVRSAHRRFNWAAEGRTASGRMVELGSMGVVTATPRAVAASDLTVRLSGRSSVGLFGGHWRYRPLDSTREREASSDTLVFAQERANRGWNWGGRFELRAPWLGTQLSFEREQRQRERAEAPQEIVSHSISAAQSVPSATVSLRWNHWREEGAGAREYLSGGLSLRLPGDASLVFQQQTAWQEPGGVRLVSFAELSSLEFWQHCPITARVTQIHERTLGTFRPTETRGALGVRINVARGLSMEASYEMVVHPRQRQHVMQLGASRSFGGGRNRVAFPSADALAQPTRQVIGGVVFEDRNRDGVRQEDEPGIPEIAVVVDNETRQPAVSSVGGRYRVLVPPGRHLVRLLPESVPTLYLLDDLETVEIQVSADRLLDFDIPLVRRVGWVEGRVVLADDSVTRVADLTPIGLARTKIVLDGLAFTYTDAEGRFEFRNLFAGSHEVMIDGESLAPGLRIEGENTRRVTVIGDGVAGVPCTFTLRRPVQRTVFE